MCPPSSGSSGIRLKTNRAMFSPPISEMSEAALSSKPICSMALISPAMRPTPTTEIGPLGSRGASVNAAWPTANTRAGRSSTTPATPLICWPTAGSTSPTGCGTLSTFEPMPMKPTATVAGVPSAFMTARPSASSTGRSVL